MIFSRSTEYALRAIVYLAVHSSPGKRFGVRKIAESLGFPESYLGKILQDLSRQHVISSVKGPNGGFFIDQDAMDISLLQIVETIDGLDFFKTCGLGLHECSDDKPCPIHDDYKLYLDGLYKMLSNKTIRDLKEDIKNGNVFIQPLGS